MQNGYSGLLTVGYIGLNRGLFARLKPVGLDSETYSSDRERCLPSCAGKGSSN
jgi:hypothetical protein